MSKPLNIGMIGYGFMGRAHSNAYRKVSNFFDLEYRPVLKSVCARSADKAKAFADKWGYESGAKTSISSTSVRRTTRTRTSLWRPPRPAR